MSMEKFEAIVEAAKDQELEIKELRDLLNIVKAEAIEQVKMKKTVSNGNEGVQRKKHSHKELAHGIKGISFHGTHKTFASVVVYKKPDGKQTNMYRSAGSLIDAIIRRNKSLVLLLETGLISEDEFMSYFK